MAEPKKTTENVLEGKAVAVVENGVTGVMIGGKTYEVVDLVNVPTLKQETGETVAIQFLLPIEEKINYETKTVKVEGVLKEVVEEKIINVARVKELSSGQTFSYVCNAITAANINGAYPEKSYVGRMFAIKKLGVVEGKRYKDVQIVEIREG